MKLVGLWVVRRQVPLALGLGCAGGAPLSCWHVQSRRATWRCTIHGTDATDTARAPSPEQSPRPAQTQPAARQQHGRSRPYSPTGVSALTWASPRTAQRVAAYSVVPLPTRARTHAHPTHRDNAPPESRACLTYRSPKSKVLDVVPMSARPSASHGAPRRGAVSCVGLTVRLPRQAGARVGSPTPATPAPARGAAAPPASCAAAPKHTTTQAYTHTSIHMY
jgi:hypothetical protein